MLLIISDGAVEVVDTIALGQVECAAGFAVTRVDLEYTFPWFCRVMDGDNGSGTYEQWKLAKWVFLGQECSALMAFSRPIVYPRAIGRQMKGDFVVLGCDGLGEDVIANKVTHCR